jgi:hypothetical protein
MADIVRQLGEGHCCVLVPIPGHEGKATYTRQLCDAIGALTAMPAMDLLQGNRHIALYHAKRNDMKPEGIRITFTLRHVLPPGVTAILVTTSSTPATRLMPPGRPSAEVIPVSPSSATRAIIPSTARSLIHPSMLSIW